MHKERWTGQESLRLTCEGWEASNTLGFVGIKYDPARNRRCASPARRRSRQPSISAIPTGTCSGLDAEIVC
jgi:hypothetical protein